MGIGERFSRNLGPVQGWDARTWPQTPFVPPPSTLDYAHTWLESRAGDLPCPLDLVHFDTTQVYGVAVADSLLRESLHDWRLYVSLRLKHIVTAYGCDLAAFNRVADLIKEAVVQENPGSLRYARTEVTAQETPQA